MTDRVLRHFTTLAWLALACAAAAACARPQAGGGADPAMPTRVMLGWSGDPVRTMSVTWRTWNASPGAAGQLAAFTADPSRMAPQATSAATTSRLDLGGGRAAYAHRVTFAGLEPGSSYWYRVGAGSRWSEWLRFRTASATAEPFRFIFLGDAQNGIRSLWSRAVREAVLAAPDARFVLYAGDLVAEGWDDRLWEEWADAPGFAAAMIPSLASPGNHDLRRGRASVLGGAISTVNELWKAQLTLPHDGPPDVPELADQAWFLDVQGVRIVSFDANMYTESNYDPAVKARAGARQLEWLDRVLAGNPGRWSVVVQHEPLYSTGHDRDNAELRAALLPVFERRRPDLVLQGHDHVYGRTRKLAAGRAVAADAPGTVYAVSVSGPKMYPLNQKFLDLMAVTRPDTQMYQVISVSPDRLAYEARSIGGELVDAFELRKDAAGASTLVEPPPERRAPAPPAGR